MRELSCGLSSSVAYYFGLSEEVAIVGWGLEMAAVVIQGVDRKDSLGMRKVLDGQVPRCFWITPVACLLIRKFQSIAATRDGPTIFALLPVKKILTKNRRSI